MINYIFKTIGIFAILSVLLVPGYIFFQPHDAPNVVVSEQNSGNTKIESPKIDTQSLQQPVNKTEKISPQDSEVTLTKKIQPPPQSQVLAKKKFGSETKLQETQSERPEETISHEPQKNFNHGLSPKVNHPTESEYTSSQKRLIMLITELEKQDIR